VKGLKPNTSPKPKVNANSAGKGGRASAKLAKSGTGTLLVKSVGMVGTVVCVTEGDLGILEKDRQAPPNGNRIDKDCRGAEESERLIVALTLDESREQRRGCSREG
jgi:hypothetical protein